MLKVFDEQFQPMGVMARRQVHREGRWHETFHCWFVDEQYIYVQKRSAQKEDFPSLFDITAAGHLGADETVEDGVREIEEELGISVPFHALVKVATIQDRIRLPKFHDNEFAHVYIYDATVEAADFTLQREEVGGIYRILRKDFIQLCMQQVKEISCESIDSRQSFSIGLQDFVPHEITYFELLAKYLVKSNT